MYIGSAYGRNGLKQRIFKNHQRESYRKREPEKNLYQLMAEPGVTAHYVCLAKFEDRHRSYMALLLEAIMTCLFGTLNKPVYRSIRCSELPEVDWTKAANKSDPLNFFASPSSAQVMRERTLRNAQAGGPMFVSCTNPRSTWLRVRDKAYRLKLFKLDFTIPMHIVTSWRLQDSPWVYLDFEISEGRHENAFTKYSSSADDGRRLGLKVSKIIGSDIRSFWLHRDSPAAAFVANSLFDWIQGRIVDADTHVWPRDRIPFLGPDSVTRNRHLHTSVQEERNRVEEFMERERTRLKREREEELEMDRENGRGPSFSNWLVLCYERWTWPYHQRLMAQGVRIAPCHIASPKKRRMLGLGQGIIDR